MKSKHLSYWLFLFPSLFALVIVVFVPLLMGIYYSFTNWNGQGVTEFVGIEHYVRLFNDQDFINSLFFTARFTFVSLIGINLIGLVLALLLTRKSKLNTPLRTIFFMPNLIGGIILGFIWQFIFLRSFESIAEATGWSFFAGWLSTPLTGFWGLIILYLWQMSGYIMIIYISFLNNIPTDIIEAASIDGANNWQSFWKIKIPMLAPAFTVSLFLTLSGAFRVYDQNMALTGGGPFNSTQMVAMNIFNTAFRANNMAYAQAQAFVFLIFVTIISISQLYITRRKETNL